MKLAMVEWVDSCQHSGWDSPDSFPGISRCVSVGMVKQISGCVQIINHLDKTTGNVSGVMSIPNNCVTRIRYLEVKY